MDGLAAAASLVVPVTLAKGLEFDHVIVVEPGRSPRPRPAVCTGSTSR